MKRHYIKLDLTDREINQLRELMDSLPLNPYGPLVVAVLKALPLEPGNESHRRVHELPEEPAMRLTPLTERGKAAMPAVSRLLQQAGLLP